MRCAGRHGARTFSGAAALWLLASMVATARANPDESVRARPIVVASKAFTESVVLAEILTQALQRSGVPARHAQELGGTRIVWNALERGDVDVYVEYTGTLLREVFAGEDVDDASLPAALAPRGVGIAARLGFNNAYVLGMLAGSAESLGIRRLSDLRAHQALRYGFSNEFLSRTDGWPGLRDRYGLVAAEPRGLQHDLAYRAIATGAVDVIDLYSTDAEIPTYGLVALDDDLHWFPRYDAVVVHRLDVGARVVSVLRRLDGVLDETQMAALNAEVRIAGRKESDVARDFLASQGLVAPAGDSESRTAKRSGERWTAFVDRTLEHLVLVGVSLAAAIALAVPLGIAGHLRPRFGEVALAVTGVVQTIPALALLVFMIPWFGIGVWPAIAALFLYSLLPIVRNTHLGLQGVPADVRESAIVLGLPVAARLRLVELPLAMPAILAGIRTAAVINIGTATLGALIGAGGYGEPILTGIRLDDQRLVLEGAVPAAALALVVQGLRPWRSRSRQPAGAARSD